MPTIAPTLRTLISCGAEMTSHRRVAQNALRLVQQMFTFQMNTVVSFVDWDFRDDAPRVVPAGDMAARSLEIASTSDVVIAIFGAELPPITREEVRKAAERKANGEEVELLVYVHKRKRTAAHDEFIKAINDEFGAQIVWTPFETMVDLQGRVFMALIPYALEQAGVLARPTAVAK